MKNSEPLDNFLTYLRNIQQEYDIAVMSEQEAGDKTQDILHNLELCENKYHDYAKLSIALAKVRRERRVAKDQKQQLQPMVDWLGQNGKTIKELEKVLGETRKAERSQEGRLYNPKTEIIEETLKK